MFGLVIWRSAATGHLYVISRYSRRNAFRYRLTN